MINLAGLKAVGESMKIPLTYYNCNLTILFNLLEMMKQYNVSNFVFSSSACVYGDPQYLPMDEAHPVGDCANTYGRTKFFSEKILEDQHQADKHFNAIVLRYFNPVGAHESGLIGEDPKGIPNNLMPFLLQVIIGKRPKLSVFGNDYETIDGTGVRDYIHVVDLAKGHIAALRKLKTNCGFKAYNLGTGQGYSVLQMVEEMKRASSRDVPYEITDRRDGDIPVSFANPKLAEEELCWKAEKGLAEMCRDSWNWQSLNPNGYSKQQ